MAKTWDDYQREAAFRKEFGIETQFDKLIEKYGVSPKLMPTQGYSVAPSLKFGQRVPASQLTPEIKGRLPDFKKISSGILKGVRDVTTRQRPPGSPPPTYIPGTVVPGQYQDFTPEQRSKIKGAVVSGVGAVKEFLERLPQPREDYVRKPLPGMDRVTGYEDLSPQELLRRLPGRKPGYVPPPEPERISRYEDLTPQEFVRGLPGEKEGYVPPPKPERVSRYEEGFGPEVISPVVSKTTGAIKLFGEKAFTISPELGPTLIKAAKTLPFRFARIKRETDVTLPVFGRISEVKLEVPTKEQMETGAPIPGTKYTADYYTMEDIHDKFATARGKSFQAKVESHGNVTNNFNKWVNDRIENGTWTGIAEELETARRVSEKLQNEGIIIENELRKRGAAPSLYETVGASFAPPEWGTARAGWASQERSAKEWLTQHGDKLIVPSAVSLAGIGIAGGLLVGGIGAVGGVGGTALSMAPRAVQTGAQIARTAGIWGLTGLTAYETGIPTEIAKTTGLAPDVESMGIFYKPTGPQKFEQSVIGAAAVATLPFFGAQVAREGSFATRFKTRTVGEDPFQIKMLSPTGKVQTVRETGTIKTGLFGVKKDYRLYQPFELVGEGTDISRIGLTRLYIKKKGKWVRAPLKGRLNWDYILRTQNWRQFSNIELNKLADELVKNKIYSRRADALRAIKGNKLSVRAPVSFLQKVSKTGDIVETQQITPRLGGFKLAPEGKKGFRIVDYTTEELESPFWRKPRVSELTIKAEEPVFKVGKTKVDILQKGADLKSYAGIQVSETPTTIYGVGRVKTKQVFATEKIRQNSREKLKLLKQIGSDDLKEAGILRVKDMKTTTGLIYVDKKGNPIRLSSNYARIVRKVPTTEVRTKRAQFAGLGTEDVPITKPINVFEVEPLNLNTLEISKTSSVGYTKGSAGYKSVFKTTSLDQGSTDYLVLKSKKGGFTNPLTGETYDAISIYRPGEEYKVAFGSGVATTQPATLFGQKLPIQKYAFWRSAAKQDPSITKIEKKFYSSSGVSKELAEKAKEEVILLGPRKEEMVLKFTNREERLILARGSQWEKQQVMRDVITRVEGTIASIPEPGIYRLGDITTYGAKMEQARVRGLNIFSPSSVDFGIGDVKAGKIRLEAAGIVATDKKLNQLWKSTVSKKNLKRFLELEKIEATTPKFFPTFKEVGKVRVTKGKVTTIHGKTLPSIDKVQYEASRINVLAAEKVERLRKLYPTGSVKFDKGYNAIIKRRDKLIDKLYEHYGPSELKEIRAGAKKYLKPGELSEISNLIPRTITSKEIKEMRVFAGPKAPGLVSDVPLANLGRYKITPPEERAIFDMKPIVQVGVKAEPALQVMPEITPSVNVLINPTVKPIPSPKPVVAPFVTVKPQPIVMPKIQPLVQPKVQPKIKPLVQPKVQPLVQPKVQPMIYPRVMPLVQPRIKPLVQPKVKPKVQPTIRPIQQPLVQPRPPTQPIPFPPVIPSFVDSRGAGRERYTRGFETFVRKRGKWIKVGAPAPKAVALRKGAKYVRETLAATFRVAPTAKKVRAVDAKFAPSPKVFRAPKRKTKIPGEVFIQRGGKEPVFVKGARLATRGERRQIKLLRKAPSKII